MYTSYLRSSQAFGASPGQDFRGFLTPYIIWTRVHARELTRRAAQAPLPKPAQLRVPDKSRRVPGGRPTGGPGTHDVASQRTGRFRRNDSTRRTAIPTRGFA